ncbi:MAG: hypothetical protein B7Z37_26565 [Verrucomicrobia bacterium 12-59-8]|nr:MAG: hypothetical protein B7Z37_26565 [Verrucomicrobia bacterium 12-59-8]
MVNLGARMQKKRAVKGKRRRTAGRTRMPKAATQLVNPSRSVSPAVLFQSFLKRFPQPVNTPAFRRAAATMAKRLLDSRFNAVSDCRDALVVLLACQPLPWIKVAERLRPDCYDLAFVTEVRVEGGRTPMVSLVIGVATEAGVLTRQFDWPEHKIQASSVEALLAETGLSLWWSSEDDWPVWTRWSLEAYDHRKSLTKRPGSSVWLTGLAFGQLDDQFYEQRVGNVDPLGVMSINGGAIHYDYELGVVDVEHEYVTGNSAITIGDAMAFWATRWCVAADQLVAAATRYRLVSDISLAVDCGIPPAGYLPVLLFRPHVRVLVRCYDLQLRSFVSSAKAFDGLVLGSGLVDLVRRLADPVLAPFVDIVANKSTGQNILLQGPPGIGKTLICERMAEYTKRPLYVVQAAQLGLSVTELSRRLQVVAQRAKRWDAAVLIDDADVFVAPRNRGLEQNAIVGEIQRFLERDGLQVFLTTNCEVDTAVLSRCFAILRIPPPGRAEQIAIWKSLATRNNMEFSDSLVATICRENKLTGRTILQLLKLIHQVGLPQPYRVADVKGLLKYVLVK